MKFNKKYETLLTTDTAGMMDYWSSTTYKFPKGVLAFKHKMDTDLYAMMRAKTRVRTRTLACEPRRHTKGNSPAQSRPTGPIRRRKRGYILMTDQSDAGSGSAAGSVAP
eukprot:1195862-Prorocentrum_minimum.AAC.1